MLCLGGAGGASHGRLRGQMWGAEAHTLAGYCCQGSRTQSSRGAQLRRRKGSAKQQGWVSCVPGDEQEKQGEASKQGTLHCAQYVRRGGLVSAVAAKHPPKPLARQRRQRRCGIMREH